MKAFIQRPPCRLDLEVVVYREAGRASYAAAAGVAEDGQIIWRDVAEGQELPVFFRCTPDVLEALLRATGDIVPASDATTAHLNDAIGIRDRLLSLVEEGWTS